MHWYDPLSTPGNGFLNPVRIDVVGALVRLNGHWLGADIADRQPGGDVGVAGNQDFIARSDPEGYQGKVKSIQPVANANAVLDAQIFRKFTLERFQFLPENKVAAV
jgi:hypothetical protein